MTLSDILTDDVVRLIGTGLAAGFLYLVGRISDTTKRARVEAAVDAAIPVAFNFVEELSRKTDNKVDDKVSVALGAFRDYLATKGITPTSADEDRARLTFNALHAQSKAITAEALVKAATPIVG